jgi:hypothetical protein
MTDLFVGQRICIICEKSKRICDFARVGNDIICQSCFDNDKENLNRIPVQRDTIYTKSGTILWFEHVEAWRKYAEKFGHSQSAKRIAERGGFSYFELVSFLGHNPRTFIEN